MELKRSLLNHLTHLLAYGYVIPVVTYIHKCMENETLDNSLIRNFVSEVREGGRKDVDYWVGGVVFFCGKFRFNKPQGK